MIAGFDAASAVATSHSIVPDAQPFNIAFTHSSLLGNFPEAKRRRLPTIFSIFYCLAIQAVPSFLYLPHRKRQKSGDKNHE
jgi:hypothetical protein